MATPLVLVLVLVGASDIWKVPIALPPAAIAVCLIVAISASLHATRPTKTTSR